MEDWFDAPIIEEEEEEVNKENFFFRFLTDISYEKEFLLNEDNQSQYYPYMVNRFLSMDVGTIMFAQEMNSRPSLDKDLHYQYLLNAVRKKKRYFKYMKNEKNEQAQLLSEYYNININKAKEVLPLHTKDDLKVIASKLNTGGVNEKKRKRRTRSK